MSCVGLCTCVVVPVLVVVQSAHASHEVAYSPYLAALNQFPRWARALLLPRGWWLRREDAARRWGALFFFTAGPSHVAFCLAPYIRPVAASVAAVVVDVPCTGRMVFLGCVHALLAVAVLMVRPHRIGWGWLLQRRDGCPPSVHDCDDTDAWIGGDVAWDIVADERDGRRLCRCDHRARSAGRAGASLGAPRGECVCGSRRLKRTPCRRWPSTACASSALLQSAPRHAEQRDKMTCGVRALYLGHCWLIAKWGRVTFLSEQRLEDYISLVFTRFIMLVGLVCTPFFFFS